MTKLIKIIGFTFLLIIVLSITIDDRTIFHHIYSPLSKLTIPAQEITENLVSKGVRSTASYSKKLFANSIPRVKDSVKSKLSAPIKSGLPGEYVDNVDKEKLDELLK